MSLAKTYKLRCDGHNLRYVMLYLRVSSREDMVALADKTREQRSADDEGCHAFSELELSAAVARKTAKKAGWERRMFAKPHYPGAKNTSAVAFDLCPHCSSNIPKP